MEILNGAPASELSKVVFNRMPTGTDIGYTVPTLWLDEVANKAYILVDVTAGVATWSENGAGLGYTAENVANKVTSISGASTDTQYPSAKLFYDSLSKEIIVGLKTTDSPVFAGVTIGVISGLVKATAGVFGNALVGTDYEGPLTFSTGLTRATNTITSNLSTGIADGQSVIGGTAASETLTLSSTSHATKGKIFFGTSAYDEVNNRLGVGTNTPGNLVDIFKAAASGQVGPVMRLMRSYLSNGYGAAIVHGNANSQDYLDFNVSYNSDPASSNPNNVLRLISGGGGKAGISTPTTSALTGRLTVATTDDTSSGIVSAFDNRHFVVGSLTAGLAFSYSSTNSNAYITAIAPGVAWKGLRFQSANMGFYTGSGVTLGLYQNASGNVGLKTASPLASLDANPTTIGVDSFTRPFPAITAVQQAALTNLVTGVGIYNTDDKVLKLYNGSEFRSQTMDNVVFVNSLADLPAAAAGEIPLGSNKLYDFGGKLLTFSNALRFPATGGCELYNLKMIYTGTGAFFRLAATDGNTRQIRSATVQASNAAGNIFAISASGSGIGSAFIVKDLAIAPLDGVNHGALKIGTIANTTFVLNTAQFLNVEQSLDVSNIYSADLSIFKTSLIPGGTGNLLTFSGTNGIIQINGYSPILASSSQYGVFFNPAGTYAGVTYFGSIPTFSGTATKANVFAATSYNQATIGFKFTGNVNIPNSTVSLVTSSEGNTSTYTVIQGASYKTLVSTGINFTGKFSERTSLATDGTVTYNGLEDITLNVDVTVNAEPQTATKLLRTQIGIIKVAQIVVTFTNATDVVNEPATPRVNGDTIIYKNSLGTLPTGLDKNEVYYVISKTTDTFQVSHTLGGAPALFTTDGTGTNSYQVINISDQIGRSSITAANAMDLIAKDLCSVSTGDTINMFVWNDDDAVDILVRNVYMRIKE